MEFKTVYPQLCDNEDGCLAVAEYEFTDIEYGDSVEIEGTVDKIERKTVRTKVLGYACIECFEDVKKQLSKEKKDG